MSYNDYEKTDSPNEGNEGNYHNSNYKFEMISSIRELFDILKKDNQDFNLEDIEKFRGKVNEYNDKYKRLLYSEISNLFFKCEENEVGTVLSNLEELTDVSLNNIEQNKANKTDVVILKIYDHINLANQQIFHLKDSDSTIKNKVDDYLEDNLSELKNGMEENNRNMITNLISLVGIFTALSFAVFGGITSFQSIFSNIKGVPLTKVMILGCIWSLAIVNIVFFLIYFMAKLTKRDIRTNQFSSSFLRRYPLICLTNMTIITIFIMSLWLRFVEIASGKEWIIGITKNNKDLLSFGSILVLIIIGVLWTFVLSRLNRQYD